MAKGGRPGSGGRSEGVVTTRAVEDKVWRLSSLAGSLETEREIRNARDALDDVFWYHRTGRGNTRFDSDFVNMTEKQSMDFLRKLGERTRSRDKNVSVAKRMMAQMRNERLRQ